MPKPSDLDLGEIRAHILDNKNAAWIQNIMAHKDPPVNLSLSTIYKYIARVEQNLPIRLSGLSDF